MDRTKALLGEPLAIVGVLEALIAFALTFGPWDQNTQGVIMAVVIAAGALVGAWGTEQTLLNGLTGLVVAVGTAFATFHVSWSENQQALLIALVTAAVGLYFNRKQSTPEAKRPAYPEAQVD